MPLYAVGDLVPRVDPTAFVAPTASIAGDVEVHAGASVWYGAVVRGDTSYAVIGPGANVQDGAVVHGRAGQPAIIGSEASIAHNAVVHGATIGERALVGNGALVLDGAVVGAGALVAAGAVVPPGMEIPAGHLAVGLPARDRGPIEPGSVQEEWVQGNPGRYQRLAALHTAGLRELDREAVEPPEER